MPISARNQLRGTIAAVKTGAVNSEVHLALPGGGQIVAIVTNDSVASLNLVVGQTAVALIKASSVLVMTDSGDLRLSARNCLAGMVKAIHTGPVSAGVCIALTDGTEIHATITRHAVDELGLKDGMPASAVFKAPSVILAVPA